MRHNRRYEPTDNLEDDFSLGLEELGDDAIPADSKYTGDAMYSVYDPKYLKSLTFNIELVANQMMENPDDCESTAQYIVHCLSGAIDVNRLVVDPLIKRLASGKPILKCTPDTWSDPGEDGVVLLDIDAAQIDREIDGIPANIKENTALYDWLRLWPTCSSYCLVHVRNIGDLGVNIRRFEALLHDTSRRAIILSGIRGADGWRNIMPMIRPGYAVFALG